MFGQLRHCLLVAATTWLIYFRLNSKQDSDIWELKEYSYGTNLGTKGGWVLHPRGLAFSIYRGSL